MNGYKDVSNLSILQELGKIIIKNTNDDIPSNLGVRLYAKNTLDHYSDKPLYGSIENSDKEIVEYLKSIKSRIVWLDMRKSVSFVLECNRCGYSKVVIYNV